MPITMLTTLFAPDWWRGSTRCIEDLAPGLAQRGHDFQVVAAGVEAHSQEKNKGCFKHWIRR
jgi:hypothetical protein